MKEIERIIEKWFENLNIWLNEEEFNDLIKAIEQYVIETREKAINTLEAAKYNIDFAKPSEVVKNNFRRDCNETLSKAVAELKKGLQNDKGC